MWISKPSGGGTRSQGAALGVVTLGGETPAVFAAGEARETLVAAPGCFWWVPAAEESVVAVQAGQAGEQTCLVGRTPSPAPVALEPGEALLYCGGGYIQLLLDGTVKLHGNVIIEGTVSYRGID